MNTFNHVTPNSSKYTILINTSGERQHQVRGKPDNHSVVVPNTVAVVDTLVLVAGDTGLEELDSRQDY